MTDDRLFSSFGDPSSPEPPPQRLSWKCAKYLAFVLVMPTPFYNLPDVRGRIGRLALQYRLPSMCEEVSYVRDGCLLSYGPDFTAMWRRSATYVLKILQGAKPAELPVEQPTKFNFFIN